MFNYEGKDQDYMNFAEYMRTLGKMPSQEYTNAYMSQMNPEALGEANMEPEQPQDDSWGGFRGFAAGGAGVLQGQAQLGNLAGFGDGSTANYMGEIMQRNARKKEYTIADMFPFASDYWTSGEGAAYDIGNMLGSSVALGGETALAAATGGAALGALGVGNAAAAAATAAGGSATAARAAFMTKAITGGMGRAAAKMGMPKLGKVLEGPMGTLYAMNILKTPLEASSEAGNAGAEALANGASLSDAQRQALIVGGLQMPLLALSNTIESSGLGGLFLKEAEKAGGKKLGKEGLLAILGNITREGVNNAWEEGMQQSTHEYAQDKQNLLGVVNPFQWSDEALQQAAVGGVGGLAIGGGNAAMRAFSTRGGDETAAPQAQEAAEAQENTPMPEVPAQEESVTPATPAESAAEYLDTISQQDGNLSMEQRRGIWDVLDSGNEQAVIDAATQFGWQPPVEQAAPAPVTPATTLEQQIQTAIDNVNAATANVANGGEAVEPAGTQRGNTPVAPAVAPATPAAPAKPAPVAPNQAAINVVNHIIDKLKNRDGYKGLISKNGDIDTNLLRKNLSLKNFINDTPDAVAIAEEALKGNKKALAQLNKYSPERQAAAIDAAVNGAGNWNYTDEDKKTVRDHVQKQVDTIRTVMSNKVVGKKRDATLEKAQQDELLAAAKSNDLGEILSVAKKYKVQVPNLVKRYYENNKGDGSTPVIVDGVKAAAPVKSAEPAKPVKSASPVKPVEPASGNPSPAEPTRNQPTDDAEVDALVNKKDDKAPADEALGDKKYDGTLYGLPVYKSADGSTKYLLNEQSKKVRKMGKGVDEWHDFDSAEAAKEFIAKDGTAEPENITAANKGGDNNNGGKENETYENRTGSEGSDQGSENPVQNKQPKEPVKAKTDDDEGKGENGETGKVDDNGSRAKRPQPKEPISLDKVAETYVNGDQKYADGRGIIKNMEGIPKKDKPIIKQYNSQVLKKLADEIDQKYQNGEISAQEAEEQMKKLNGAYSDSSGKFAEVDGVNGKKYASELVKKYRAAIAQGAETAKQSRTSAIERTERASKELVKEFKANAKDYDTVSKAIEELRENLVAELEKLGVKPLNKTEKKATYEDAANEVEKEQGKREAAIERERQREAAALAKKDDEGKKDKEDENGVEPASTATPEKNEPSATEKVQQSVDALTELEKEIEGVLDETGNVIRAKKTKLVSKAKKLASTKSDYTDEQNKILEAAVKRFDAAIELASENKKAEIAKANIEAGNGSVTDYINNSVNEYSDDISALEEAPAEVCSNILDSFDESAQDTIVDNNGNGELDEVAFDNFTQEEVLEEDGAPVGAYAEFLGSDTVTKGDDGIVAILKMYINRLFKAFKKIDKKYQAELDYREADNNLQEAIKAEKKSSTKYSVQFGGKLGKAMYQAAWHGTPHIIEGGRLTTAKVGTGEKAIVHGWGLYFAKSREISQKRYRERLAEQYGALPTGKIILTDPDTGETVFYNADNEEGVVEILDSESAAMQYAGESLHEARENKEDAIEDLNRRLINNEVRLEELKEATPATAEEIEAYNKRLREMSLDDIMNLSDNDDLATSQPLTQADIDGEINSIEERMKAIKKAIRIVEGADTSKLKQPGELLKVELPENDVLLDENKPFKQQPYRVRSALKNIAEKMGDTNSYLGYAINKNLVGEDLYRELGKLLMRTTGKHRFGKIQDSREMASKMLNDYGIKGIRYNGAIDGECFVIFDDDAIAIQERYDAALRRRGAELQRSREEVVDNIKKMFAGSKFDEQENGDLLITMKNGKKLLYKISDRIVLNEAEAQEARKAHGISEDVEVTAEGRYRPVYESDIDSIVEVGLDSRKNTEAHETTHAVIDLALGKEKAKPLFDRAEKLKKEYGLKADAEEIACDAVRDFVTARENGFITTFTTKEVAELKKTFWGRMLLKANSMGAKAKVFSDKNEAELKKTVWGKMLLAKMQLQRGVAKLMRAIYDFYKKFQAVREANDNFHNLARKIELGEVWGEKTSASERNSDGDKYQAKKSKLDEELQKKIDEDSDRFSNIVDEWAKNPKEWFENHKTQTFDFMSQTPLVLTITGAKQLPLKITAGFLGHSAKSKHPGMTAKVLKQLPKAIVEPLMILKDFENVNGIRTEFPNKRVLVLGVKNEHGATVIVPIKIDADDKRGYGKINLVQNAFGVGETKPKYQYFVDALKNNEVLYIDDKKSLAWAKTTNGARTDTLVGLIRKRASDNSVLHKQDLVNARQTNPGKYSVRYAKKDKDIQVSSINLNYKKQLEDAFARNATDGEIAYIMNQHQKELAEYFKDRGEKRKEHAKLRAAELKQLRKDFKAGVIDSYEVGGMTVRRDAKGKEVVEKLTDELPNRTYENKRHENEDFKNASASAKLGAAIKREKPKTMLQSAKDWLQEAKDNFYKQWVDKYDALRIFDKAIEDKSGKRVHAEQTVLGKMQMVANYASGAARAIIEGDKHSLKPVADTYHIKNLTSLKDMMEKLMADCKAGKFKDYVKSANLDGDTSIQGYINALENYLTALTLWESSQNHKLDYDREVAEWQNKGARGKKPEFEEYKFPNNMTEDEIKDIIRSAPKEFRQYQVIFKGFTDNLLDIMLNSGLITADRYDTLKTRYKFYCPLMRDFSDTAAVDDFISQINSGKGLGNVSDPLKSRSSGGSVRDVISPLTTAVKTASAICMKAERNRVGQYMVRQAKKHRLDEFVHEVKGNSGDANNCIFTVMINGEKHAYQTTPELYPAITAAVEPLCKIQMALLTKPAQLLRAGSTMSPSFILRNFLRDTLFATVASKNGFIPIYDSFRGGYALLKNRERRGEFDAAGVISSNFYSDAEAVQKSLVEMAGGKSWQELTSWEIVKAIVSKPVAGLEWVSNLIEASTRMGEFMRARDKGKSVEEAAYDAVEITLNFGRSGATGQQFNRMIPFFNACIQGGDKLYRLFKSDPKTTMLRIGTYIILPSIVLWAANHDEDWYKELDPAIKMNNWILPGGSIRIPKPQEAGVLFGSGFEAALDAAAGQDQKAMGEWATTFLENMTPGVMPTLILPLIEWMVNYSFFRNKPVVSQSMQRLPDELQYGPYTSETSKFVGGIAGVSPAKLDNLWRGYTGTMGMFLIQAPDLWAADKQNLPEKKLSEMAFVRDFAINDMNLNRTMNDFYRLKEAATKQHAGYGKKGKPTAEVAGVNVAAQSISKLQKEAREITASPKYNSAQKRVLVDKLQAKQKKIAQFCIKKYGNKFDY